MPGLDTDVVVVGAGITGAATAYELARSGRAVVLLDQFELGHDRGSSHGDSRVFRLSYPDPAWVRLAQEALGGWRRLEADSGEQLLRPTGSVDVGSYAAVNQRALAKCGAAATTLEPAEAARRWGLVLEPSEAAIYQPDAGVLYAARALNVLHDGARAGGAKVVTAIRAERVEAHADAVRVETRTGDVTARVAVVAAGAWAQRIVAPLGIDLCVTPTRETVVYLDVADASALPVLIFGRPEQVGGDGVGTYALADGSTTLKVGVHRTGPVTDPDESGDPEPWVAEWACEWAAQRLPSADASVKRSETCIYTNTPDDSFILERHGRVVVASACSGHAFKFAPAIARTVAALATDAVAAGNP